MINSRTNILYNMIILVIQWLLGAFELVSGIFYDDSGYIELGSINCTSLTMAIGSSSITYYK